MLSKNIGIDLGTTNVLIYVQNKGIVVDEPSIVVVDEQKNIVAVGNDAKDMLGRTPYKLKAIKPMKDGVIADFEVTEAMINYFLRKIRVKKVFVKPNILICCPVNITKVERNAIRDVAEKIGAKNVFIEEEPKVAAIGSLIDISKANGSMIVDIGGGTTDIAVLSLGDIVSSVSIPIAGNTFDDEIIKFVKEKYSLLIGERTAEQIKIRLGNISTKSKNEVQKVTGRNLITGLPDVVTVCNDEIDNALRLSIYKIIDSIKFVLENTPPELSSDIIVNGITITGGGSLLKGLDKLIEKELNISIHVSKNPLTSVIEGTKILLENLSYIDE